MINIKSETNKQIVSFIKEAIGRSDVPVYNTNSLTNTPVEKERIEFRLTGFRSTGQIYQTSDIVNELEVGSISEYRCRLIIRAIGFPEFSNNAMSDISGGIQTHGYLEQYVDNLYIENETIRVSYYPVKEDGVMYIMSQISVDCYIGIEFKREIDYFTKVEDVKINIK